MSKSPSLRRIQADVRELALDPSDQYHAAPLENDMFEWHFTIRGPHKTDFEEGIYHGRILLPPEYPVSDTLRNTSRDFTTVLTLL